MSEEYLNIIRYLAVKELQILYWGSINYKYIIELPENRFLSKSSFKPGLQYDYKKGYVSKIEINPLHLDKSHILVSSKRSYFYCKKYCLKSLFEFTEVHKPYLLLYNYDIIYDPRLNQERLFNYFMDKYQSDYNNRNLDLFSILNNKRIHLFTEELKDEFIKRRIDIFDYIERDVAQPIYN